MERFLATEKCMAGSEAEAESENLYNCIKNITKDTSAGNEKQALLCIYTKLLKIDTNAKESNEELLKWACRSGNKEIVQILIDRGVDVNYNVKQEYESTPLHLASYYGYTEIVKLLLKNKAYINAKNKNSESPLYLATLKQNTEIIRLLLKKGADTNVENDKRETPLHKASKGGPIYTEIVQILISYRADVNAQDNTIKTPLHYASMDGNIETFKILISSGADVDAQDYYGWTPLQYASINGHTEVVKILIEHGADVNIEIENKILVNYFISKKNMSMAKTLLYYYPKNSKICIKNSDILRQVRDYSDRNAINKMKILQIEGVGYEILEFVSEVLLPREHIKMRRNLICTKI